MQGKNRDWQTKFISETEKIPQRTCATKILPNFRVNFLVRLASNWRVPNPPLVAERAPWRSSQFGVAGSQQPIGNPYRFLSHFFCTPGDPRATPIVTCGEGSFSYQEVSTRGVRHSPAKPLFYYWEVPSNLSESSLVLFVRIFGFGVIFWPLSE